MTNDAHLELVGARLRDAILSFCRDHLGRQFHADDLRQHVHDAVGACAPGSADRVLRMLRKHGAIDYTCVSRTASLYRVDAVNLGYDLA